MTRQILALLALLSGLAALSAPANASPLEALSANVEASSHSEKPHSAVVLDEACAGRGILTDVSAVARTPRPRHPAILAAPVIIGADRALE